MITIFSKITNAVEILELIIFRIFVYKILPFPPSFFIFFKCSTFRFFLLFCLFLLLFLVLLLVFVAVVVVVLLLQLPLPILFSFLFSFSFSFSFSVSYLFTFFIMKEKVSMLEKISKKAN